MSSSAGCAERGVTIFLTTHRLEEAERLCDRVAILNTTLRTIGRPDELRERLFSRDAYGQDPSSVAQSGGGIRRPSRCHKLAHRRPRRLRTGRPRPDDRSAGGDPCPVSNGG